jgi:hypothetical protein
MYLHCTICICTQKAQCEPLIFVTRQLPLILHAHNLSIKYTYSCISGHYFTFNDINLGMLQGTLMSSLTTYISLADASLSLNTYK